MRGLITLLGTTFAFTSAAIAGAQTDVSSPTAPTYAPHWVKGTEIELMVIKEVNSRTSSTGDQVTLRVNAPITVDGKVVIPVGAAGTGEVITATGTSAVGGKGQISLRLISVDTRWGPVKLSGTKGTQGDGNTSGVIAGVLAFGIFGLLTKGGNAVFKGGDIITGYIDQGEAPKAAPLIIGQ
jgi:hypothetical protein